MTVVEAVLNKHAHMPQLEIVTFASLAAGSATDPTAGQETFITALPDPSLFFAPSALGSGVTGELSKMRQLIEYCAFVSNGAAATLGNATHFADLQLLLYRYQSTNLPSSTNPGIYLQGILAYYSLKVATTIGTAITSSNVGTLVAVTPAAMTGIVPGMLLAVDQGAAGYELVKVISTTATTFSAYFYQQHASNGTVKSILQPNFPVPLVLTNGPVSTTIATSITLNATSQAVTPATMYGIHVGDQLVIDTSTNAETVTVLAVSTTQFTAIFAKNHTGPGIVVVTATGAAGAQQLVQGSALYNGVRFECQASDVLKFTRTSNDATGIATPAGSVVVDWTPVGSVKA